MKTLRIKERQEEKIRKLAIEINKQLVQMGKQPLRDSEIVHSLLDQALNNAKLNQEGKLVL